MSVDLKVENGTLVIPGSGLVRAGVALDQGKIVAVAKESHLPKAEETIDASGKFVLPGLFDPHTHLGIFSSFENECETETRSALSGGITTLGCYIAQQESYLQAFNDLKTVAEQRIFTDLVPHLVINNEVQLAEMKEYVKRLGVTSFKLYMCGIPGLIPYVDDGFIFEAFKEAASIGYPATVCVHAENATMVDKALEKLKKRTDNDTLADWSNSHPNIAEEEAVIRACYLASKAHARLYLVHTSTKEAIESLSQIRTKVQDVFVETTSAYLSLSKVDDIGLYGKMVPPLREKESVERLWWGIVNGIVDTIGTDSVAMTKETKKTDKGIWEAMPGYPFVGIHLPVLLNEGVHKRNISLLRITELCTKNPSVIFGLYPQKGTIAVGSDGDLVVVDLKREKTVRHEELHSYVDWYPLENKKLKGWPVMTIKDGVVVVDENEILGKPGQGKLIPRTTQSSILYPRDTTL